MKRKHDGLGHRVRPRLGRAGAVVLVCLASLLVSGASSADPKDDNKRLMGSTRGALSEWLELRKQIAEENRDYQRGCDLVKSQIDMVKEEIQSVRERIAKAKKTIAETEKQRDEKLQRKQELVDAIAVLEKNVERLEARAKKVVPRLPEPVQTQVKGLVELIPADPNTKVSLAQRYLNLTAIINLTNKFNQEISPPGKIDLKLPDGTTLQVDAVYLGIGQGYCVDASDKIASIGTGAGDKWEWTPANESAKAIREIMDVLANKKPAVFIKTPVKIQ